MMREVKNMTEKTFGVIGVCGANGNLIARILSERGYDVIGTDLTPENKCRFSKSLEGYDIELFYGETPDEFFEKADYVVPPASLSKKSSVFKKIDNVYELDDVIENFHPEKPVFGITGTNGKTTTTTLLKKIAYDNGIEPAEHNLEKNAGKCRIHSDFTVKTPWGCSNPRSWNLWCSGNRKKNCGFI